LAAKYLAQAGIKGASVHTLRHTFATHHIEMGTDLVTVQEFLGHRSLDTTKLYVGLAKKRQAQHIQEHAL
jgi:site-specific recombinase XerD